MITTTATHLLYDGQGAWIAATRVWIDPPHPEVDDAEAGWGWQFSNGRDLLRWLASS